jgi:hypothetical protein
MYISVALEKDAAPVDNVVAEVPLQLPTITAEGFDDMQKQVASMRYYILCSDVVVILTSSFSIFMVTIRV